ncbi:MAG: DUF3574 domain-containing protein [Parvibaculum sp.]|nr:DUF3574 domain-containing protein [Parvibaculum sp.]
MTRRFIHVFLVVLALAVVASPRHAAVADPVSGVVQTTLYFGLDRGDGGTVSEREWRRFLAEVVTPRFPDGLTVVDAYGQWRDAGLADAAIVREATKVVIVVHDATPDAVAALAAIKADYMERFGQRSVFHTEAPVRVVE